MRKLHYFAIISGIFLIGALFLLTHSSTHSENDKWYGPASAAFDDYLWYYHELPPTLSALASFIEMRNTQLRDDRYCFGDADIICREFRRREYAYSFNTDSCCYHGRRINGMKERVSRYSLSYCYGNPEIVGSLLQGDLYDWKEPVFFDKYGYRCHDELSSVFKDALKVCYGDNTGFLNKHAKNKISFFHIHFLFEYADYELNIIDSGYGIDNTLVLTSNSSNTKLRVEFNDYENTCKEWLGVLKDYVSSFITMYPDIERIIFPAPLLTYD